MQKNRLPFPTDKHLKSLQLKVITIGIRLKKVKKIPLNWLKKILKQSNLGSKFKFFKLAYKSKIQFVFLLQTVR